MVFDVMIKEVEKNAAGKDKINVVRVHDRILSEYLRQVQNNGKYIVSVIPLFRLKKEIDPAEEFVERNIEKLNSGEMYMKSMRLTLDSIS